jgi:hypothetical protein
LKAFDLTWWSVGVTAEVFVFEFQQEREDSGSAGAQTVTGDDKIEVGTSEKDFKKFSTNFYHAEHIT